MWKLLAVETVLVVTCVLLAPGQNRWRQSRADNALAGRAVICDLLRIQTDLSEEHQNLLAIENEHYGDSISTINIYE